LRVTVGDEGPGLEGENLERLFEPFVRGRAARQASAGTGLGLAIARGLLAAEGGHLWAERAEPGRGARFTLAVDASQRSLQVEEAWS
jgi:signal transduction histidine kinase